jgi:hypothetical protein
MKKCVDTLEKGETEVAQGKARTAMEGSFQQLLEKHIRELEAHERLRHKLCLQMRIGNETEMAPLDAAVKKLEGLQVTPMIPRRSPTVSKSRLVTKRSGEVVRDDGPPIQTPRTMQRLHRIRSTLRGDVLALKKVECTAFVRANRPKDEKRRTRKSLDSAF